MDNYFKGNQLAQDVWKSKYALKDLSGEVVEESPEDMHKRMSKEFARISQSYGWDNSKEGLSDYGKSRDVLDNEEVFSLFDKFKHIIPQGSIMSGLGDTFRYKSLSNCIVVDDVVDSYGGIMYSDQQLAQLMKRRCGVGIDISKLRPKGTITKNAAKTSTGAVSFLKRFSDTTNEVAQEGRRGALMVTLSCKHPDIMEFIKSKDASDKITGANISVKWTKDFIDAVKNKEEYTLRWPVDSTVEEAEITKVVDAKEVFTQAAMYAHGYDQSKETNAVGFGGDPGCMFIDRMIEYSTDCGYPGITVLSTNPCGEIGMHNDCCRLIALNFMSAIENPFQDDAHINITKLYKIAYEQQVLLDNLVDLEIEAIDRIIEKVKFDSEHDKYKRIELETWNDLRDSAIEVRRTGGGFTALGDALAALGIEYGSEKGNQVVEELMKVKFEGEWDASIDLAIQRGSFPKWDSQYDSTEFFDMMEGEFPNIYKRNNEHGRRNISLSTVAPTGSVSLLANINGEFGTTSGIEPVFSTEPNVLWYTRNKKSQEGDPVDYTDEEGNDWMQYKVFHEGFKQWLDNNRNKHNLPEGAAKHLSKDGLIQLAKKSPYVTSAELDYKQRIKVQSIVQKYTTHSISSTLNLPQDAHWSTTEDIYMKAYDAGLKGVTIFRDGSKRGVLESSDNSSDNNSIIYNNAPKRPKVLEADVWTFSRDIVYIIIIGKLNNQPYEIFVLRGDVGELPEYIHQNGKIIKVGSKNYNFESKQSSINNILQYSPSSDADVLTRFVSMLMRHGVKMDYIVEQVEKADITITDFSNVVNRVLRQYTTEEYTSTVDCDKCNGENVHYVEGCLVCKECGMSKCG